MSLTLNCDLGESFGSWKMGMDAAVMPFIDQANIACGFHAGDPLVMRKTLQLAKEHGVTVGAHPAYPDLVGFGRRSMACQPAEIIAMVQYQVAAIDGMAKSLGMELAYVKPHGAMYNDMMAKTEVRLAIMEAIATYHRPLALMLQATPESAAHRQEAADKGIGVMFEAFADRAYDDQGHLVARSQPNAVLDKDAALRQVKMMLEQGLVVSQSGKTLSMRADTLCVHGDNPEAIALVHAIRSLLDQT